MSTIRRFKEKDKEAALLLIEDVWGGAYAKFTRKRWEWEFEANPLNLGSEHIALVLEDGDKVVGMISSMWTLLKVHEKVIRALWVGYFMVHPDYRGRQGLRLARAMVRKEPYLHMGFPMGKVRRFWKRMGSLDFCRIDLYVHIIDMQSYLRNKMSNKIMPVLAGWFWKVFRELYLRFRLRRHQGLDLCEVHRFDERIDDFWKEASRELKITKVKDHTYLNWRFADYPTRRYSIWLAKRVEKIVGYVVFRVEEKEGLRHGHIVDFLTGANDAEALSCLIERAIQELAAKGADVVGCRVATQSKVIQKVLRQEGFFFKKRGAQGGFINNSAEVSNEELTKFKDWFITAGDTELDII